MLIQRLCVWGLQSREFEGNGIARISGFTKEIMAAQMILGEFDEFLRRRFASFGEQLFVDVFAQLLDAECVQASCGWHWGFRQLVFWPSDMVCTRMVSPANVLRSSCCWPAARAAAEDCQRSWTAHLRCARCFTIRTKLAAAQPLRR